MSVQTVLSVKERARIETERQREADRLRMLALAQRLRTQAGPVAGSSLQTAGKDA